MVSLIVGRAVRVRLLHHVSTLSVKRNFCGQGGR
jgi:hypothetical protein